MMNKGVDDSKEGFNNTTNEVADVDTVSHFILIGGVVPVSALGLFGNVLTLVTWHAHKSRNVSTFLFKTLAVWDIVFLASFSFVLLGRYGVPYEAVLAFGHVTGWAQLLSVNVTLLIGVTRWIAVFRPHQLASLLTLHRAHIAVGGMVLWCTLLQCLDLTWTLGFVQDRSVKVAIFLSKQTVGFILPLLFLLIFNILLIVTIHRSVKIDNQSQQKRQATLLVICISICSLVAYPIGVLMQMLLEEASTGDLSSGRFCDRMCFNIANSLFYLLQVLNSSLNILFYSLFSTTFRKLLFKRRKRPRSAIPGTPVLVS